MQSNTIKPSQAHFVEFPCFDYNTIWQYQIKIVNDRKDGHILNDIILFVEHSPVLTLGKNGSLSNLLVTRNFLKQKNIELMEIERGGDITYHGPGQIVIYPLLDLNAKKVGIARYVECLENIMIKTALEYGVYAERNSSRRGVYVGEKKLGSVGIAVKKGISFHGLSLNVNVSLEPFSWIHPCGFENMVMTSLEAESDTAISMNDALSKIKHHVEEELAIHSLELSYKDFLKKFICREDINVTCCTEKRKPVWLKKPILSGAKHERVRTLIKGSRLKTVCQEAKCPNQFECFSNQTATFLIMGDRCTRNCGFCAIKQGPVSSPDPEEPVRVAQSAKAMNLGYVVVTSVTRDDVPDGGASVFADSIREIRKKIFKVKVEVLIPDFKGDKKAIEAVLDARPDVLNHNIETVPRLYESVRPEAVYERSLGLLKHAAHYASEIPIKSGLMLGLGENPGEIESVLLDLYSAGCRMLTLGQYLKPTKTHLEVHRFISPDEFALWRECALEIGFVSVASGPFVRSSYKAEKMLRFLSRNG